MRSKRTLKGKMLKVKKFRDHRKSLKNCKQKHGVIRLVFKQNLNHWPKADNRLGRYLNRD